MLARRPLLTPSRRRKATDGALSVLWLIVAVGLLVGACYGLHWLREALDAIP